MGGSLARNRSLCRMVEKTVEALDIQVFVETGTYKGATALWAASVFRDVYTIDINPRMQSSAIEAAKRSGVKNIHAILGDSGDVLSSLLPRKIHELALFWIDAHDDKHRPPIREELAAIVPHPYDHIIFIDDARLFVLQNLVEWPSLGELRRRLDGYTMVLVHDAIMAYTPKHEKLLKQIVAHEHGAVLLQEVVS